MRWPWLRALRAVHDGAAVTTRHEAAAALNACAVFPGRESMPYSLGSVLGGAVARFLPLQLVHAYCATLDVAYADQVKGFTTVWPSAASRRAHTRSCSSHQPP
jgi:hypothetical protein